MITLARVQAEAAKAVAEMGRDFVYNEGGSYCFYRVAEVGTRKNTLGETIKLGDPKTMTPCIIGRILDSLHLMTDHIRTCTTSVTGLFGPKADGYDGPYEGVFDQAAVRYMDLLQVKQDNSCGLTWGECYDYVEARVARGEIG